VAKLIPEISVFFPTFNEEGNILRVIENVKNTLEGLAINWEIIVVNDGSKDRTLEIVNEIIKGDKRIRVISHETNLGYGASLKTGFYNSRYKWICFIDSDGQFDFSEVTLFVEKQKETNADMIIGFYRHRQVSLTKRITSKLWEFLVFVLFGLKVHDIDCGFKFTSKRVIDEIPKLESERGAFISSELLIKTKKRGFNIVEIPVTHYPRLRGVGTGRNLNVIITSFMDLFRLWIKLT
jgi:glycosyltransferase involved in cell wall biosynthesis